MDYEWVEEPVQSQTFYNDQVFRHHGYQNNVRQKHDNYSSRYNKNWRDKNSSNNFQQPNDHQKQSIKVPSKFVGRIIGI